jgi:hypothetical protein
MAHLGIRTPMTWQPSFQRIEMKSSAHPGPSQATADQPRDDRVRSRDDAGVVSCDLDQEDARADLSADWADLPYRRFGSVARVRRRGAHELAAALAATVCAGGTMIASAGSSHADNTRLDNGVLTNIFKAQKMNGCQVPPHRDPQLIEAARVHTLDVLNSPGLDGDIGSDGSAPQDRARAAGFLGRVSETIAINPWLAINGIDVLNQWWYEPNARATMQDCRNTAIGVWSENSLNRSVLVAVYGEPTAG